MSSSSSARLPSTKDKLSSIVQGFDDFDTEMKRGTRVSQFLSYTNPNTVSKLCHLLLYDILLLVLTELQL